jgi:hypothetical protein
MDGSSSRGWVNFFQHQAQETGDPEEEVEKEDLVAWASSR